MDVEKSIQTIEKVLIKLKELPDKNFDFNTWVTKLDENEDINNCNTVCCAYGWFPTWFPNSGIKYHVNNNEEIVLNYAHNHSKVLELTGFSEEISNCLFEGRSVYNKERKLIEGIELDFSKQEVIEHWEKVLNFIKENKDLFKPIGTLD